MERSFFNRKDPVVTFLTHGATVAEICDGIAEAYQAGAEGIAVEMFDLPPEERIRSSLK